MRLVDYLASLLFMTPVILTIGGVAVAFSCDLSETRNAHRWMTAFVAFVLLLAAGLAVHGMEVLPR